MNLDGVTNEINELSFLPGTASLIDEVDKKIMVILQDGRNLIGILRSFDQYANLVLEQTLERIIVGNLYGDKPLGLFIVRGDNIVLMGTIDSNREDLSVSTLTRVSLTEIEAARKEEWKEKEAQCILKRKLNEEFLYYTED